MSPLGIRTRLQYLQMVGLGYLALDRSSNTLSEEKRRGSTLPPVWEPPSRIRSLPSTNQPLLTRPRHRKITKILRSLADAGNYVCVVEHDEQVIRAADKIVELARLPVQRAEKLLAGPFPKCLNRNIPDGKWLKKNHQRHSGGSTETKCKKNLKYLRIQKASRHNLRKFSQKIPLNQFVCIAGISGSGKSTLLNEVIHQAYGKKDGVSSVLSDQTFSDVALIDQTSVARTPRSNPVMYADAWGPIREAFGRTDEAKRLGFHAGDFSFNAGNGRCESCKGLGYKQVEMQFLSDIQIPCEQCEGKRFKDELLQVKLDGLSVHDILNLTIEESLPRFSQLPKTFRKLSMLCKVGLGYLNLGQPLNTLSGGESQRLKLVKYMSSFAKGTDPCLLLIDEPTTGLHFEDIDRLLNCLFEIRDAGHSLIVIEHNPQVLKNADWILN